MEEVSCDLREKNKTGCCGYCWLNVAGDYDIWKVVSSKCQGSIEEKTMIDDIYHDKKDKKEFLDKYNFTEDEKRILGACWN